MPEPELLPPTLSTPRLRLRSPELADAEAMFKSYAGDSAVTEYLVWSAHRTPAESLDYLRHCQQQRNAGRQFSYFIQPLPSEDITGMVTAEISSHTATIGYVLARSRWGQGLMTEAVTALIQALLRLPHIHRVEATCDVENLASVAVLQKCGMRLEGLLRSFTVHPQVSSTPRDCFIFAVTRAQASGHSRLS